jgi:hypothetical protein
MWHPLWREDGSVVYNCCWASPAQSFSDLGPTGLTTTFYCLRFETPPTWRARSLSFYPPGTGWPGYTPRHWVPFSSPPTTRRATVEVFDPASTRNWCIYLNQSSQSQSQCYFTTSGLPPISWSWRQAPWDPRRDIFFFLFNWAFMVVVLLWLEDGFVS